MRNRLVRVTSMLFAFILCVSNCLFCYAADSPSYTTNTNIWHWMNENWLLNGLTLNILPYLKSTDVCGESEDGKHHASFVTGINDENYFTCVCEYCGNEFVSSNKAQEAETEYVSTLPASSVTSDGTVLWQVSLDDLDSMKEYIFNTYSRWVFPIDISAFPLNGFVDNVRYYVDALSKSKFHVIDYGKRGSVSYKTYGFIEQFTIVCPISGIYDIVQSTLAAGDLSILRSSNSDTITSFNYNYSALSFCATSGECVNIFGKDNFYSYFITSQVSAAEFDFYLPAFVVTPSAGSYDVSTSDTSATYNTGTRAASITGNYGIVNSGSGEVTKIDTQTIVNETNNTYYSPAAGEQQSFTEWSYDYGDRTYNLTTESGDTVTVTYGDENVTVYEGDTTTNIYYIIESSSGENGGGGEDTPSTPTHIHSYTSEVTKEPTCTRAGIRTYTCDGCGNTYTENIPATGHAWEVLTDELTQYSSDGQLLQEGFTIYECSVCGQQYRVDNDSLPPAVIGENLELQNVSENVQSLFPSLSNMYEGYLGFLSATFPYIPDEIMQLFYFGISSVVLVGIFKALRG